jgi:hypothetical protein
MRGLVAAVLAGLLASGCGGSPEPGPLPAPEKSSTPSASATPAPPVMPKAAKAKTRAGAEAFVRHYVQLVNYAGANGDTGPLRDASLDTCVKCMALADGIDKVYSSGGRIIGGGWTLVRAKHYGFKRGHYFLDATIDSAPQQMMEKSGAQPTSFPGTSKRLRAFVLERSGSLWKVSELDPSA